MDPPSMPILYVFSIIGGTMLLAVVIPPWGLVAAQTLAKGKSAQQYESSEETASEASKDEKEVKKKK
jgi:hypothetical protein